MKINTIGHLVKTNSNKPNVKSEGRRQKAEYGPAGYGEGLRRDESGLVPAKRGPLAMTVKNMKYRIMKEN